MTALDLLRQLRRQGAVLILDGDRLRIEAPTGLITEDMRQQLADHKAEIVAELRRQHDAVAALSLDQLARAGLIVRVHSTVLGGDVLFVSDNVPEAIVQRQELPVYRAHELRTLAVLKPQPRGLRRLHEVKRVFKGTIAAVEDRPAENTNPRP